MFCLSVSSLETHILRGKLTGLQFKFHVQKFIFLRKLQSLSGDDHPPGRDTLTQLLEPWKIRKPLMKSVALFGRKHFFIWLYFRDKDKHLLTRCHYCFLSDFWALIVEDHIYHLNESSKWARGKEDQLNEERLLL